MKNVAFKEEEFQMVQVLLQNYLDQLTENEFFEHSQDTHKKETICMSAITAMRHPIADEIWEIHQTLPEDKTIFNIISSDYNFSSYASLSLLSLFYAIIQGLLFGAGIGFLSYAVGCLFYGTINLFGFNIAGFFICIVFLLFWLV